MDWIHDNYKSNFSVVFLVESQPERATPVLGLDRPNNSASQHGLKNNQVNNENKRHVWKMKIIIKHFLSLKQSYLENSLLTLNKKYFCPSHKNQTLQIMLKYCWWTYKMLLESYQWTYKTLFDGQKVRRSGIFKVRVLSVSQVIPIVQVLRKPVTSVPFKKQ